MAKGKTRKARNANKVRTQIKAIETKYWNDKTLSLSDKIYKIVNELDNLNFGNPEVIHAITKWKDKLKRLN